LDNQSLRRFNFYAPYVKNLKREIWGVTLDEAWDTLLKLVPTRPILPNLQRFTFSIFDPHENIKLLLCIEALACPTLVEISCSGPGGQILSMDPLVVPQLVAMIAERCPDIHTLEIYTLVDSFVDKGSLPRRHRRVKFSSSLEQLCNLRTFGIGSELLSPNLYALLGSLPVLTSLTIHFPYDQPVSQHVVLVKDYISLPSESFPSLQHLGVACEFESIELILPLWKIQPLVQHLTSVHIQFNPIVTRASADLLADLFHFICQSSPHITDLHMDMRPSGNRPVLRILPTAISHLQRCSFQRIHIWQAELSQTCSFEQLALALPNLEYLNLPKQLVKYEDLVQLARHIPKLRFLAVRLDLRGWPRQDQRLHLDESPSTLYLESDFYFPAQNMTQSSYIESMAA
jgi:hypothetical protein